MNQTSRLAFGTVLAFGLSWCANAWSSDAMQISEVELQLSRLQETVRNVEIQQEALQNRVATKAGPGAAVFLFGVFCALWAQNTGRNAWLWFFLGLLFSVITGLVLLYKNSQDRKRFSADT